MSSLKKNPSFKGSQSPVHSPSDYVPQHPYYTFKPEPIAALDGVTATRWCHIHAGIAGKKSNVFYTLLTLLL